MSFKVPKNLENLHLPTLVKILTITITIETTTDIRKGPKCTEEMPQKLELASI